jgi:Type II secretion system (T2SS), protein F
MTSLLLLAGALLVAPWQPRALARLYRLYPVGEPAPPARRPWLLPSVCGLACGSLVASLVGGPSGLVLAAAAGVGAGWGARRLLRETPASAPEPLRLAGGWDLLAACLRAGLPVPLAVRAVAEYLPIGPAAELRTIADRLALGADPRAAWEVPESSPVGKLAGAARRSAHSGAGLASVAVAAAGELRAAAQDLAAARGQRAGVLITGPLGLCFLPAFLTLGVVPVVIGLASGLAITW